MPDNNQNARREMWTAIVLLWLAGNALRLTILAVPPVIAMIRDEFALSATEVGLLSSIPPALFAIAALAGSLLVARLGVGSIMNVPIGYRGRRLGTMNISNEASWFRDQDAAAGLLIAPLLVPALLAE